MAGVYKTKHIFFIWHRPQLDFLLKESGGAVGSHLMGRGRLIVVAAKAQVGVKTGRLKESIDITYQKLPQGPRVKIGSDVKYALIHHEGSKPHIIVAKPPKVLKFRTKSGVVAYAKSVAHPGTKPNRYLSDHIKLAIL